MSQPYANNPLALQMLQEYQQKNLRAGSPPTQLTQQAVPTASAHTLRMRQLFGNPIRLSDRYVLFEKLGEGSYGSVYRAVDRRTGETRALKLLKDVSDEDLREIEVLRQFTSQYGCPSNIVCYREHFAATVYDKQNRPSEVYAIAMDLIDGVALENWNMSGRYVDPRTAHQLVCGLLRAVSFAHAKGIKHLDIKPANVMVRKTDGEPVLVDFGLSCNESLPANSRGTCERTQQYGSPAFMSPERQRRCVYTRNLKKCTKEVRAATDIWSLGLTLAAALAPVPPNRSNQNGYLPQIMSNAENRTLQPGYLYPLDAHIDKLLRQMLTYDSKKRPTALQLLTTYQKESRRQCHAPLPILAK